MYLKIDDFKNVIKDCTKCKFSGWNLYIKNNSDCIIEQEDFFSLSMFFSWFYKFKKKIKNKKSMWNSHNQLFSYNQLPHLAMNSSFTIFRPGVIPQRPQGLIPPCTGLRSRRIVWESLCGRQSSPDCWPQEQRSSDNAWEAAQDYPRQSEWKGTIMMMMVIRMIIDKRKRMAMMMMISKMIVHFTNNTHDGNRYSEWLLLLD